MSKEEALYQFWNSFGVDAYDEADVPDEKDITYPYITYEVKTDSLNNVVMLRANVYDKNSSWRKARIIKDTISKRILEYGFVTIPFDEGNYIYLTGGTPFAQRIDDPTDDRIKRYYINLQAEFLCAY